MLRTQIQLTEEQAAALRRLARQRGVSMAAIVREATEAFLREADLGPERRELAREVVGKYASGRADIAREHDRELGELFGR